MWSIVGIVLAVAVVAAVFNIGGFGDKVNSWMGKTATETGTEENLLTTNCPSDGVTTFQLYTPDKLASTATDVVAEYYIYDGNQLVKSGTTSSGSASIDLTCGKDYQGVALNTTASSGAYAETFEVKARSAKQSATVPLVQFGGAKILGIENPADPSRIANISIAAGATKQFDIKFAANVTEKGYAKPLIMCQVNISSIKSVNIGSFSDGTKVTTVTALPKRVAASANYQYYAWEYPKILDPSGPVVTASGSIAAQASVTPSTADSMSCKLVDQATFKMSDFKSLGLTAGFITSAENTETLADIGAADSSAASLYFVNGNGY